MIYTEVLPFVWLGSIAALVTIVSAVSLTADTTLAQSYMPSFLTYCCDAIYYATISRWWFWPPFLFIVAKISHAIATGRNCVALQSHTDLTGKVAIVTGANSGIGYHTALQLAEMGATVILACRDEAKAAATARNILDEIVKKRGGRRMGGGIANVEHFLMDGSGSASGRGSPQQQQQQQQQPEGGGAAAASETTNPSSSRSNSPQQIGAKTPLRILSQYNKEVTLRTDLTIEMDDFVSVKRFCSRFLALGLPLHFLVNNAGMMVTDVQFSKFNPDLELHTAVNFIGPLLLTELLWERLCQTTKELSASIIAKTEDETTPTQMTPQQANKLMMTRSRVVFVASEAHQFPTLDPKLKWFDKKTNQPVNRGINNNISSSASPNGEQQQHPIVSALKSANKGKANASGLIINPSVSRTMAGFVRYGFSKLADIYAAHYFVNKEAPFPVLESLLSDEEKQTVAEAVAEAEVVKSAGGVETATLTPATSPKDDDETVKKASIGGSPTTSVNSTRSIPIAVERTIRRSLKKKMHPKLHLTPLVVALHPGLINTNFANNILSIYQYVTFITLTFQKTPFSGSQTSVYACIANERELQPHLATSNPYWRVVGNGGNDEEEEVENTSSAVSGGGSNVTLSLSSPTPTPTHRYRNVAPSTRCAIPPFKFASRYLAECSDYSNSAMQPIAWSLADARDVVEWALADVLKVR